jgi:hypothetical protein
MSSINRAASTAPLYTSDSIFGPTSQVSSGGGGFRRVLGGIASVAGNLAFPGLGSVLGSAIGGGLSGGVDTGRFLAIQAQVQAEQREFELQSTLLKVRHDMSMSAIRNMK